MSVLLPGPLFEYSGEEPITIINPDYPLANLRGLLCSNGNWACKMLTNKEHREYLKTQRTTEKMRLKSQRSYRHKK